MTEYSYASPAKTNGIVYRSFTEAMWARLFTGLRIRFDYEPTTFEFPDGVTYTPDFFLKSVKRYVEIKNENVDTISCQKLNNLARHLGGYTMLLNGNPKVASAYIFDGRPPRNGWEARDNPLSDFAVQEIYGHNAGSVTNRLLQPDPFAAEQKQILNRPNVNRLVKSLHIGIDYDITETEKTALRTKIFSRKQEYVVFAPETPEMFQRYSTEPERQSAVFEEILAKLQQTALKNNTY